MANKKYFYVGKGRLDEHPYLYYGENSPVIVKERINGMISGCIFVGSFQDNPIADSIKDGEIIKIHIRKEKESKNK